MGAASGSDGDGGALASFRATDGSGLWEVYSWGISVGGEKYYFTGQSHIVSTGVPGRTERRTQLVEEPDDGFGLWAALAVYQETGSLRDAGLAAWALGGSDVRVQTENRQIPGNVQLSIGGLRRGRQRDTSLRYREDGRWVQVGDIQRFADATLAAIKAYRADGL